MANVGAGSAYAVSARGLLERLLQQNLEPRLCFKADLIAVQRVYYGQRRTFACQYFFYSRGSKFNGCILNTSSKDQWMITMSTQLVRSPAAHMTSCCACLTRGGDRLASLLVE